MGFLTVESDTLSVALRPLNSVEKKNAVVRNINFFCIYSFEMTQLRRVRLSKNYYWNFPLVFVSRGFAPNKASKRTDDQFIKRVAIYQARVGKCGKHPRPMKIFDFTFNPLSIAKGLCYRFLFDSKFMSF